MVNVIRHECSFNVIKKFYKIENFGKRNEYSALLTKGSNVVNRNVKK